MAKIEELRTPAIPETGPKPLTTDGIKHNLSELKDRRIKTLGSKSTACSSMGIFQTVNRYEPDLLSTYLSRYYWSQELLRFNGQPHLLKINKYGNLEVYETQGEIFISAQKKPKIIIEPKDIREVDRKIEGHVRPSGFVLENCQYFDLETQEMVSLEKLEEMLLVAEKNDHPQSTYRDSKGFAKVDPKLAGKDVLVIPFRQVSLDAGYGFRRHDAVVIDVKEQQLMPRVFYTVGPNADK